MSNGACFGTYVRDADVEYRRGSYGIAKCRGLYWIGVFLPGGLKLARPVKQYDLRYFEISLQAFSRRRDS